MIRRSVIVLSLLSSLTLCGADLDEVIRDVEKDLQAARRELQQQRQEILKKREQEHAALTKLDAELAAARDELEQLVAERPAVETELADLQKQERQLRRQSTAAWELVGENRKECELVFIQAGLPNNGLAALDKHLNAADAESPALLAAMELLVDNYREHYARCSQLRRTRGTVIAPDGATYDGRLLRVGGVGALFVDDERIALAVPVPGSEHLHLQPGQLDEAEAADVRRALADPAARVWLPLDITDGRAMVQLGRDRSLFQWLQAGGPIVVPLLIVAFLALGMVVERALFLTRLDSNVDRILGEIMPLVKSRDYDGALAALQSGSGPVRQVLRSGLEQGRRTTENLEEILQESVLAELPALERFLGALAVLAAVSPLLGLLGTVSGMIATFEVITAYGAGDARLLSGGISEALITTEIGLIVAVPILLAHAWLNRHVRIVVGHVDRAAISLVGAIREAEQLATSEPTTETGEHD